MLVEAKGREGTGLRRNPERFVRVHVIREAGHSVRLMTTMSTCDALAESTLMATVLSVEVPSGTASFCGAKLPPPKLT